MWLVFIVTLCMVQAESGGSDSDWARDSCGDQRCRCLWSQGKKAAECNNSSLTAIPNGLSTHVQLLSLNHNNLQTLPAKAFKDVKLIHLQKLYIQHANLRTVHKDALIGMSLVIEIDLSYNNIKYLHHDIFRPCEKIREIIITHNPIIKIEPGLFSHFGFLQRVDFSYCELTQLSVGAFHNLTAFTTLELQGNHLQTMELAVVQNLTKLRNLGLTNNPWNCNCSLRALRDYVVNTKSTLYAKGTTCRIKDDLKDWSDVLPEQFACSPQILNFIRESSGVLSCLTSGDPPPTVQWQYNGQAITNVSTAEYLINAHSGWHNLTVRKSWGSDVGEYKCIATNAAGIDVKKLDVRFSDDDNTLFSQRPQFDVWPLIIGVMMGALILLSIILVICCCLCKRNNSGAVKKDKSAQNELEEKTLMSSVNPVQKPPRRPDTSLHSSETELLDSSIHQYTENGSIIGSIQSDGVPLTMNRSRDGDSSDPPDLLAFPAKSEHGSPVDSLPQLRQKPLISPQFGTLPYARSHSPFSPPTPVVIPPAGYVTIPRRPRVPSWTASLSPVLVSPEDPLFCEPIYDNLGPRTTADGSSVLSLNKADLSSPVTSLRQKWSHADSGERACLILPQQNPSSGVPQKKIPPNPPPKPKKKPSKGIFDDEGEDGTEV